MIGITRATEAGTGWTGEGQAGARINSSEADEPKKLEGNGLVPTMHCSALAVKTSVARAASNASSRHDMARTLSADGVPW